MSEQTVRLRDFASGRSFRLWDFRVSHSLLLIRSPRAAGESADENVDLIFTGVDYLALPTILTGVRVTVDSAEFLEEISPRLARPVSQGCRLYNIESTGKVHSVIAAHLAVAWTTCDVMESSLVLHFSPREGDEERFRQQYVRAYEVIDGL